MFLKAPRKWSRLALLLLALSGVAVFMSSVAQIPQAVADDDGGDDDGGDDDGGDDDGGDDDDGGNGGGGAGGGNGGLVDDDATTKSRKRCTRRGKGGARCAEEWDDDDHEYVWSARRHGRIRALRGILNDVRRRYGGEVLSVKVKKKKKGRIWYEIRILDRHDRVRKVRVPASRRRQNFNADND